MVIVSNPPMDRVVLLSTHNLSLAGALREGFLGAGYRVEFLTPDEDPRRFGPVGLLVLTGGVETPRSQELIRMVRMDLMAPVFGVVGEGGERGSLSEAFLAPPEVDEILLLGRTALERVRLQQLTGIVGETDAMVEVLERVLQIAPAEATVLVTGESGTGKELVARGIHGLSQRRHETFLAVNVAALSDTLLESELFGHEKGAFTGAIDLRKGLFELADRGTIFLDEIGDMPLQTQTKLLRVLEQHEFLRVGGQEPIRVDVRIIAATNQRLRLLVEAGEFRKDLYYRLNVLNISLPPLRERREDIPRLVRAFIEEASQRYDREFLGISDEAMDILIEHGWPGNVRELRNLIESMVVLAPGTMIQPRDIPDEVRRGDRGMALVAQPMARAGANGASKVVAVGDENVRPQLEFLFHAMMDLKVDMEDFRREFEAFRYSSAGGAPGGAKRASKVHGASFNFPSAPGEATGTLGDSGDRREIAVSRGELRGLTDIADMVPGPVRGRGAEDRLMAADAGTLLYRPGMTMDEVEREVIRVTLNEVRGNRRKAAEMLEIGERTLYRKIKKYGLDE